MKIKNLNLNNRLDIFLRVKLIELYITKNEKYNFIKKVYDKYIKVATGWIEHNKKSLDNYENEFIKLINNFSKNWYNSEYPIKINSSWNIIDGCHRLACCIYFWVEAKFQIVDKDISIIQDYSWFLKKWFDSLELFEIVNCYLKYNINFSIFIVWPFMYDKINLIKNDLKKYWNVIFNYELDIKNNNQIYELTNDIYSFDLNTIKNNNFTINKKIALINSSKNKKINIIILDKAKNNINDRIIKEKLRDKYTNWIQIDISDKKYYTFHSWEWSKENNYIKNIFINKNIFTYSLRQNILQNSKLIKYLDILNNYCVENKIDKSSICIVWWSIMNIYWLKKLNDLDVLIWNDILEIKWNDIILHKNIKYSTSLSNKDLLINDNSVFRWFKIIDLHTLYKIKIEKNREKDIDDIKNINDFLENQKIKKDYLLIFNFKIQYYKKILIVYFFMGATKITRKLWIYKLCSYIWRKYFLKHKI